MKQFKVVPFNPQVSEKEVEAGANQKLSAMLEELINREASQGWNYSGYESIPITVHPNSGCLAMFSKQQAVTVRYGNVIFVRDR